jgi:hypothetical protein
MILPLRRARRHDPTKDSNNSFTLTIENYVLMRSEARNPASSEMYKREFVEKADRFPGANVPWVLTAVELEASARLAGLVRARRLDVRSPGS